MKSLIKDEQWAIILDRLRKINGIHTSDEARLRRFIDAILYIRNAGCKWRNLPEALGNWRSVHARFKRWSKMQIWKKLFHDVIDQMDNDEIIIDSTVVKAHPCAAGYKKNSAQEQCLGRSCGGFTTKIHVAVNALGNPLKFILTPGNHSDITQGRKLLKDYKNANVIADKAYDSEEFVNFITKNQCQAVIPSRKTNKNPREYKFCLYKERHLVECFFRKIKDFRRIWARYDKTAEAFLGFLYLTGAMIWLK